MSKIGSWLRQLGTKLSWSLRRFMEGRYGTDKLNMVILIASMVIVVIYSLFIKSALVQLILCGVSYALMIWAIFRCFSRNTYKRYEENRKFLRFTEQLRDRDHRYFNCPRCRQRVRVPRGKGKISITCPKCREKFVKKT